LLLGGALVVAIAVFPPFRQRQLLTFNDAALYFNTLCLLGMLMPRRPSPTAHRPQPTCPFFFCPCYRIPRRRPSTSTCHKQRFENF